MNKNDNSLVRHRFFEGGRGLIVSKEQNEIRLVRDEYHEMGMEIKNINRIISSASILENKNNNSNFQKSIIGNGRLFEKKIEFINSQFESKVIENFEVRIFPHDERHYSRLNELRELAKTLSSNIQFDESYKHDRSVSVYYDIEKIDVGYGYERATFIEISLGVDLFNEIYRSIEYSKIQQFKIWVRFLNAFTQVEQSENIASSNFFAPLIEGWGVLHGLVSSFNIIFDDSKL